jgi:hypothetical protein
MNNYGPFVTNSNKLWLETSNKDAMFIHHNTRESAIGIVSLCEFNAVYAELFVRNPEIS